MKTRHPENRLSLQPCSWLMALALLAGGCHSVGYKTGDTTATSFHKAARALQTESTALDLTISSLNDLVANPAGDLKPQFKAYRANLMRLIASVEKSDDAISKLRDKSGAYFTAWDSELSAMNYEAVRNQSESRKLSVSNRVFTVCQRYDETQGVVRPLISYFEDIQKALGTDLTADGLAAAQNIVGNAAENTRKIQAALTQLTSEMSVSSVRFSSTKGSEPARDVVSKASESRAEIRAP